MLVKTLFAGFGGQGILSMGMTLAHAAMLEGKNVTYMPSYGTEVRGGTANCTVAISDEEIASPVASAPEFIVVMNLPSLVRFQNHLESGGVLFINSSLADAEIVRGDIEIIRIAANDIADGMNMPRAANTVMLGAFAAVTGLISLPSLEKGARIILANFSKEKLALNLEAIRAGYEEVKHGTTVH